MTTAEIQRVDGGYIVSRKVTNLPAAMRCVDALLVVPEHAFESHPKPEAILPTGVVPHEVAGALQAALDRLEADDPPPHDGRPLAYPVDEE